jgi:hypothetical protein
MECSGGICGALDELLVGGRVVGALAMPGWECVRHLSFQRRKTLRRPLTSDEEWVVSGIVRVVIPSVLRVSFFPSQSRPAFVDVLYTCLGANTARFVPDAKYHKNKCTEKKTKKKKG